MESKLNPYINFNGKTKEAMEFYKTIFGGKLEMTTLKDAGMNSDPIEGEKIMHAMLEADNGITFMAADVMSKENGVGTNINLALSGSDESELTTYFKKLSEEGTVREPLTKAPWGDTFGMLTDKFGIEWMVNIAAAHR